MVTSVRKSLALLFLHEDGDLGASVEGKNTFNWWSKPGQKGPKTYKTQKITIPKRKTGIRV